MKDNNNLFIYYHTYASSYIFFHLQLFTNIDHFLSMHVTASRPSLMSTEVSLCCYMRSSIGNELQFWPCQSLIELSWLTLAKKLPFSSYFMSEMSFICAGMRLSSFFLRISKMDMTLALPATATSKPLGWKRLQRIESLCLTSQTPFPVLKSHSMPQPPRSPVKQSDWSGWRQEVCIYFQWPRWVNILLSLLPSQRIQDLSQEELRKCVPVSMQVMLLILSLCPSFITAFCSFSSLINVHTSSSPLVEPVMMLGAEAGMTPTLGLKSTPHIFEGAFNDVTSQQKLAEFGFSVFHTLPSPLEPTVMQSLPLGAKTPLVTELVSPYSVATFSK